MKKTVIITLVTCMLGLAPMLYAQNTGADVNSDSGKGGLSFSQDSAGSEPFFLDDYKKPFRYATLAGVPLISFWYGWKAWGWGDNRGWHWADEKWFQYDTQHGGVDKIGHAWTHFWIQRTLYQIFNYTENGDSSKWIYSGVLTGVIGTMIEVGDAMADKYGFGTGDLIFDFAGLGLGILFDAVPWIDDFFSFTWGWIPSDPYREYSKKWQDFTQDYSGHKYLLSFKLAGFEKMGWDIPDFMRYIKLDVGYYVKGYEEYDRLAGIPESEKSRYFMFGISVNFEEVAADFFEKRDSRYSEMAQYPFKYFHVPVSYEHGIAIDK